MKKAKMKKATVVSTEKRIAGTGKIGGRVLWWNGRLSETNRNKSMRGKDGEAASGAPYEEYLTALLRGLVNNPAEVKIEKTNDDRGVLLRARVAIIVTGKQIGRAHV